MTDIPVSRTNIQIEGSQFRSAVSEFLIQSVGAGINFINNRQHSEKQFFLNGRYGSLPTPFLGVDGLTVWEFDAEIINIWMFILEAGSGGTTELDLKIATTPGGAFTSIFSTTPKATSATSNFSWIGIGDTVTGMTAPVFSTVNANGYYEVNAGDALRFDILSNQSGTPRSTGLLCHYRPR